MYLYVQGLSIDTISIDKSYQVTQSLEEKSCFTKAHTRRVHTVQTHEICFYGIYFYRISFY
jgi:hypothetical protein